MMEKQSELKEILERIEGRQFSLEIVLENILDKLSTLEIQKTYEEVKRSHENLKEKYEKLDLTLQDNVRRVNFMLLEMKGVISIVRPSVRLWVNDKIVETEDFTQKKLMGGKL